MQQIIDIPGVGEVEFPDSMSDDEISAAAKRLHDEANRPPSIGDRLSDARSAVVNTGVGAVKGALRTAVDLGNIVSAPLRHVPGVRDYVGTPEEFAQARAMFEPQGTAEKVGNFVEQGAEFMIPAGATRAVAARVAPRIIPRLIPRMAADAASSAAVAGVHGDDPKAAAALGAVVPVAGAVVGSAANLAKRAAPRLVQAALKPNVTSLKQMAGANQAGLDEMAKRVSQFIVDNRLTTPDKAQTLVSNALQEIQALVGSQPTNAPQLAKRYLEVFERQAARQGLPADHVSAIHNAMTELVEGPMGEQIGTTLKFANPGGKLQIQPGAPIRALRPEVPADEALASARTSSRFATKRQWGEQKGTATEATKKVELAQRNAVKAAVPATRPYFETASEGIKARDLLQREALREGNRDVAGLTGQIVAGAEISHGRFPILGIAANILRSGQLQGGMLADRLANALKNNDVQLVSEILARMGVSAGADAAGEP